MSGLATASLVVMAICAVLWTLIAFVGSILFFFMVIPMLKSVRRDLSRLLDTAEKELRSTLRSAQQVGQEVREFVGVGNRVGREAVLGMLFNRQGLAANTNKSRLGTLLTIIEAALLISRLFSKPKRDTLEQTRVPTGGE